MKYIEHIFSGAENELEHWQSIFGGTITGNTLVTSMGVIKEYIFEHHKIVVFRVNLTEEIRSFRIVTKPITYYPIILSEHLTFESGAEGETNAVFSNPVSAGIYFSNENAAFQFPVNKEFTMVLFRVTRDGFERVLPTDHPFLKNLKSDAPFFYYESLSSDMRILMHHLLDDSLAELLEREFTSVYSWELFLLFVKKFFYERQHNYKQINKELLQKLQQVKEYLLQDLSVPKNIDELTRYSGMSATKLRASFKEVYGMTIYNLYQEHRMEKARELLLEGNKSVSEVAYQLGYTHLGHFTGAFKQKFNCLPKDLRK